MRTAQRKRARGRPWAQKDLKTTQAAKGTQGRMSDICRLCSCPCASKRIEELQRTESSCSGGGCFTRRRFVRAASLLCNRPSVAWGTRMRFVHSRSLTVSCTSFSESVNDVALLDVLCRRVQCFVPVRQHVPRACSALPFAGCPTLGLLGSASSWSLRRPWCAAAQACSFPRSAHRDSPYSAHSCSSLEQAPIPPASPGPSFSRVLCDLPPRRASRRGHMAHTAPELARHGT